jgi:hypothetical protein
MEKITADVAKIMDNPKAAQSTWTTQPDIMPATDTNPAFFPWAALRVRIYMVSEPGVKVRMIAAMINPM